MEVNRALVDDFVEVTTADILKKKASVLVINVREFLERIFMVRFPAAKRIYEITKSKGKTLP